MSWEMYTDVKPRIFNYNKAERIYRQANPQYYSWATGDIWKEYEACIKFINDTNIPMKISHLAIKSCACDSGGSGYWSAGGYVNNPCKGYGATYYSYIRVTNDGSNFSESSVGENKIPTIDGSNMNSPGTGIYNTAVFGYPPYTGNKGLVLREYTIQNCPIINVGGIAYIHFGVKEFDGPETDTTIRFVLNPSEMEVDMEESSSSYIWQMKEYQGNGETKKRWELTDDLYMYLGDAGWRSMKEWWNL